MSEKCEHFTGQNVTEDSSKNIGAIVYGSTAVTATVTTCTAYYCAETVNNLYHCTMVLIVYCVERVNNLYHCTVV